MSNHITDDLAHKASDDTAAAIRRVWQFAETHFDQMHMATMAAASALAYSAAAMNAHLGEGHSPDEVSDAMWEILRPMVLRALGSGTQFEALLARTKGGAA